MLFLREWYMHPSGQLPAYEWALSDVNPPVHAWAAWRVYKMTGEAGSRDRQFLARVFQKLLLNFTWWVNRKDVDGRHLFAGGFLGLDNIGVFNRSEALPSGHQLQQADGTAWMAFYCSTMLSMALELAREDPTYADMASKFFEHFVAIVDAMNELGGTGLWDEADGFYYDRLSIDGHVLPMPIRSMVGLLPLCAVEVLDQRTIDGLPGFKKRLDWFLANRPDLARHITCMEASPHHERPATAARHPVARAARAGAAIHARRAGVPLAVRHPLGVAHSRIASVHPAVQRRRASPRLLAWRVTDRPVRRQLELARTDLAAAELSCSWKRSSAITTSTATRSPSNARPGRGGISRSSRWRARSRGGWRRSFFATSPAAARVTDTTRDMPTIRTGGTWCSSTSTFTPRPDAAAAPAIRPDGPRSPRASSPSEAARSDVHFWVCEPRVSSSVHLTFRMLDA